MEMMNRTILLLAACMVFSQGSPVYAEQIKEADVCRFGIAAVFGRSPEIVKSKHIGGGTFKVSYVRKSDGTHWHNKCRVEGNRIIWGAYDGRWRTHSADPKVTFAMTAEKIVVTETFLDGSATVKKYSIPSSN